MTMIIKKFLNSDVQNKYFNIQSNFVLLTLKKVPVIPVIVTSDIFQDRRQPRQAHMI